MTLEDFFQLLSYGPLSSLHVGMSGGGAIAPGSQDRVAAATNAGLTALYARFSQKRDYVNIELLDGVKRYQLHPRHNQSDTDPANTAPRFIVDDASQPFPGDLVKVIEVRREDDPATDGNEEGTVEMNGVLPGAIKMLTFDTLYIAQPTPGTVLEIEYQAGHRKLTLPADLSEEIDLAPPLHEALECYVAATIFRSMGGEGDLVQSQTLRAQYEAICATVKSEDLLAESDFAINHASRFRDGGWR